MKKLVVLLMVAAGLIGCATSKNPNDPYEKYNRKVFVFNMVLDHFVLRPAAVGYTYIPTPIRDAISNFYNNLRDFVSLANDILQLDGMNAMQTTMRISINSVFGIFGFIDVSSSLGLPQYKNSFGSTFKRWGWQHSSYLIVPFFGPGTVRDDLGLIPDVYFNPLFYFIQDPVISYSIFGLNLLDSRSKILGQDQIISQTLDPYATIRDLYLQKNGSYIYPTDNVNGPESSSADDSIDQLIDDQTVESAPRVNPARNSDSELDSILDEETTNRKLEASSPQSYRP